MEEETIKKRKSKLGWSLAPIFGVIVVLVLLAVFYSDLNLTGLSILESDYIPLKVESYTFDDVHNEIKKIDLIYNTDYHEEELVKNRISSEKLDSIISDLTKLYDAIELSEETGEKKILLKFVKARRGWLEAQTFFDRALRFGKNGIVTADFECKNNETVLIATYLYNQTLSRFHKVLFDLDYVLTNSQKARELIGMRENKPQIYKSIEAGQIAKTINTNIYTINRYCKR